VIHQDQDIKQDIGLVVSGKKMNKLTEWLVKPFINEVELPIKVGDVVLMGRFKNKRVKVKSITYNEKGDLQINGRPALKFRIQKSDKKLLPTKTTNKSSAEPDSDRKGVDDEYPHYKLKESPAKFQSVHLKSTFDSLFGSWYSNHVPLTTKLMQGILGKERVSVFHVGSAYASKDIANVGRIVGKKSALSTFSSVDKGEKLAKGKGIQTQGGVIYQLEGSLLVASTRDMQTHPDKTGRRWVSPTYLAGKGAGSKMFNELKKFVETNKRTRRDFDFTMGEFDTEISNQNDDLDYSDPKRIGFEERRAIVKKEGNRIKREWIVKYINFCMKMMKKYAPQIKRHILSQKDKPAEHGWNEIIVNQIKVKDVFVLSRENYPSNIKELEKFATGKITVGSPAQFRKWFNERGGLINESFFGLGAGDVPSPSRKGVEKMKKKGNTSVPYGSGYKKIDERATNAYSQGKLHKNITGFNLTYKGRKYKEIDFEVKKIDNKKDMVTLRILNPKKLFGKDLPVAFKTIRRGPFMKTDTSKKVNEQEEVKKVVAIYPGRFQPFGPHHKKVYDALSKQFDEVYITTSAIQQMPRHPLNFNEKKKHMVKMGIPSSRIVREKSPYVAINAVKKLSKDTAVVYAVGQKDRQRIPTGKKKSGGLTYFQDFKKNLKNLKGHETHGYIFIAPHQKVSGISSGTEIRNLLGSPKVDDKKREKIFKQTFGYFDKSTYETMTSRFGKLFEFVQQPEVKKIIKEVSGFGTSVNASDMSDEGMYDFFGSLDDYFRVSPEHAEILGWEVIGFPIKDSMDMAFTIEADDYEQDRAKTVTYGKTINQTRKNTDSVDNPFPKYKERMIQNLSSLNWEIIKFFGEESVLGGFIEDNDLTPEKETPLVDKDDIKKLEKDSEKGIAHIKNKLSESFVKDVKKTFLTEGGAYGHMNHPFDDNNLLFSDLKNIVIIGLEGKLNREDKVSEKLDGQNLMISWVNGKLKAARNNGHIKNRGASALDAKGMASKFAGRGQIKKAFYGAMVDLEKAIGSLSNAQQEKVFGNGTKWMNLEVIYPQTANIIDYDVAEIVFHGALEYNESGKPIGQAKDSARMLQGMIKQVNQNIQKTFRISRPNFLTIPKSQNFGKLKSQFLGQLNKLQKRYNLKDSDRLGMYHESFWKEYVFNAAKQFKVNLKSDQFIKLVNRWAYFDKTYKIPQIRKDFKSKPQFLNWILDTDKKNHMSIWKENIKPFEILFFKVGAEILKNIQGFLAVSPDKATQKIRQDVISAMNDLRKSGNIEKLQKLKIQIEKLEAIGGLNAIVPSEGLVFKYKGNLYKFTGAFAPINQILGSLKF